MKQLQEITKTIRIIREMKKTVKAKKRSPSESQKTSYKKRLTKHNAKKTTAKK